MIKLPEFLTCEQLAAKIHKSPRWTKERVKYYGLGRRAGRTILLSEGDVLGFIAALENVGGEIQPRKIARQGTRFPYRPPGEALAAALALACEKPPKKPRRR